MKKPSPQTLKGQAYRIYISELERHLNNANSLLTNSGELSQDSLTKIGASFHTLKGSSGFFGFSEMAEIAGKLEKIFLNEEVDLEESLPEVKQLIEKFKELANNLPAPL